MTRKLIEVALPLEAINRESAREKSIRHGHPSTIHIWWARRPLAACRAVIFASLVDDPSSHPDRFPTAEAQEAERQRLFRLIEELVKWENTAKEDVLQAARTALDSIAAARGVSMAQVALAWLLAQPGVTSAIVGASTVEQLQDNLAAASLRLSTDELTALTSATQLARMYPATLDRSYGFAEP